MKRLLVMVEDLKLNLPEGKQKLLMHTCCAPCCGDIMERLAESKIDYALYFYNPNIHPKKEYLLRKDENKRFADKLGIEFIDADDDYDRDRDHWFARLSGMGDEPERGKRCTGCFDQRFEKTARYAMTNRFDVITSSLGISRWKDMDQINRSGVRAAAPFANLEYWTLNWRKGGGSKRMIELSKTESFYQQEYCGCVYSLRDTNRWRVKSGRNKIKLGEKYYRFDQE
ncbi:MAG: epoxyqueuosine reductase QueH [Gammaproteobacteria bacterium]|nr:epoxyqueuosine reductase QueH [Gammaproteobacteria bacterium]